MLNSASWLCCNRRNNLQCQCDPISFEEAQPNTSDTLQSAELPIFFAASPVYCGRWSGGGRIYFGRNFSEPLIATATVAECGNSAKALGLIYINLIDNT